MIIIGVTPKQSSGRPNTRPSSRQSAIAPELKMLSPPPQIRPICLSSVFGSPGRQSRIPTTCHSPAILTPCFKVRSDEPPIRESGSKVDHSLAEPLVECHDDWLIQGAQQTQSRPIVDHFRARDCCGLIGPSGLPIPQWTVLLFSLMLFLRILGSCTPRALQSPHIQDAQSSSRNDQAANSGSRNLPAKHSASAYLIEEVEGL